MTKIGLDGSGIDAVVRQLLVRAREEDQHSSVTRETRGTPVSLSKGFCRLLPGMLPRVVLPSKSFYPSR